MEKSVYLRQTNMNQEQNHVLSADLHKSPIPTPLKDAILKSFWGATINCQTISNESELDPYFTYYSQQCRLMLGDGGRHTAARNHHDISRIVQLFEEQRDRQGILDVLQTEMYNLNLPDGEIMLQGSINLAARLYLMMSFGDVPNAYIPERALSWTTGSVQHFLTEYLQPRQVLSSESVKLQKLFNARNVQRLAGIKIEWTSDLGQHLRMIHDDEWVAIFHHASFLRLHHDSKIFPEQFIDETLRTLALLFPQSDKAVKQWVQGLPSSVDKSVRMCGRLGADARQIENFKYWHDRLVVLKQVFDEVEPGNVAGLWNDRRRQVQWYTFWTAVLVVLLTLFFGLVQCVEGALQVYKAYYPS